MERLTTAMDRLRALNSSNPDLMFTVLALLLVLIGVLTVPDNVSVGTEFKDFDGFATALIVVQTAAIAFLRRWPYPVMVFVYSLMVTQAALGYDVASIAAIGAMVIVFYLSSTKPLAQAIGTGLLTLAVIASLFSITSRATIVEASDIVYTTGIFVAIWIMGVFVYTRRARMAQVEKYAAEVEEQSARAAAEGAAEERSRIARELHDAVGHTLNLIVVQAGAALRVHDRNPEAPIEALRSIESTGRQALGDMDRMLGILREQSSDEQAGYDLGPRPGLARLDDMLGEARRAGLPVELKQEGDLHGLPVSIDLTAYRIVQEAITNVMKHAPGADTVVSIVRSPQWIKLDITNGPRRSDARPAASGGRGLAGMKERVGLFGGSIDSTPTADGGFALRVTLPIDGAA